MQVTAIDGRRGVQRGRDAAHQVVGDVQVHVAREAEDAVHPPAVRVGPAFERAQVPVEVRVVLPVLEELLEGVSHSEITEPRR